MTTYPTARHCVFAATGSKQHDSKATKRRSLKKPSNGLSSTHKSNKLAIWLKADCHHTTPQGPQTPRFMITPVIGHMVWSASTISFSSEKNEMIIHWLKSFPPTLLLYGKVEGIGLDSVHYRRYYMPSLWFSPVSLFPFLLTRYYFSIRCNASHLWLL